MRSGRIDLEALVGTTVLAGVSFFVLYPILLIVLNSFQVARPGAAAHYSIEGWRIALSDPGMLRAVYNTFSLIVTRQILSFPIAILLAWLLARTDLPGKSWLEFMFWLSFFLSSFSVTPAHPGADHGADQVIARKNALRCDILYINRNSMIFHAFFNFFLASRSPFAVSSVQ